MELNRYEMLQQGVSIERVNQLIPEYSDEYPITVSSEALNINMTKNEIDELKTKFSNDSGAFIPKVEKRFKKPKFSKLLNQLLNLEGIPRQSNNWVNNLFIKFTK